jgi:integrase
MQRAINEQNERVKRQYAVWKREARRAHTTTVDKALEAIDAFTAYTKGKDFKAFNVEQAIGFKRHLEGRSNSRTGRPLAKATIDGTLRAVKDFFMWLADQPGYRSKIKRPDLEYFNLNAKDARVAHADRDVPFPTVEQCLHAFVNMPEDTEYQRRDKAIFALLMLTAARDGAIASLLLKHVDMNDESIMQDAREVRTKDSKTFPTWFFPVDSVYLDFFSEWMAYLRKDQLFGPTDPLFPKPRMVVVNGAFKALGFQRESYAGATHIRKLVAKAFTAVELPKFNPHSFRKTIVALAMEMKVNPEEFKAWSQNLGHESIITTMSSYMPVSRARQRELIKKR